MRTRFHATLDARLGSSVSVDPDFDSDGDLYLAALTSELHSRGYLIAGVDVRSDFTNKPRGERGC